MWMYTHDAIDGEPYRLEISKEWIRSHILRADKDLGEKYTEFLTTLFPYTAFVYMKIVSIYVGWKSIVNLNLSFILFLSRTNA